jgi:plastocyanin
MSQVSRKHVFALLLIILVSAVASCSSATATPTPTATLTPTTTPINITIDLVAKNLAFDKSTITVPAGANVTINFDNQDGVSHNFALYTDSSADTLIFRGQLTTSPTTYNFTAPSTPGNYFFRCDVHPTMMTGTFVVE